MMNPLTSYSKKYLIKSFKTNLSLCHLSTLHSMTNYQLIYELRKQNMPEYGTREALINRLKQKQIWQDLFKSHASRFILPIIYTPVEPNPPVPRSVSPK